jgi:hypothetical protein
MGSFLVGGAMMEPRSHCGPLGCEIVHSQEGARGSRGNGRIYQSRESWLK